jgi:hypothetical protein
MVDIINTAWPIFVGFITLVVVLSQAYMRIQVLEEKVKVLFELHNKSKE